VLSLSFGTSDKGDNTTDLEIVDEILMEFAAAGITVLVATGKKQILVPKG